MHSYRKTRIVVQMLLLQCIPGRIQHLLASFPMHLSKDFARQHDEAITEAVAKALELGELNARDKQLMQRKISDHGLGLRSMELDAALDDNYVCCTKA